MRRPTLLLIAVALAPAPASAQGFAFVEELFESVNSVSFSVQAGGLAGSEELRGDCGPLELCGMGSEVFLNLRRTEKVLLELALGTGYLRGFSAREPTIDLRGAVRSAPTLGVYVSHLLAVDSGAVLPFVGVQVGLAELWNVQAYDSDGTEYSLEGSTYDLGASAGLALDRGPLDGLFVEASYRHRRFPSVNWDAERVLPGWPRELDLSAWFLSVGWQFDVDGGEGGETPGGGGS